VIDPVTALSLATATFSGIKKAVQIGKDAEEVFRQLSKWATAIEDVKEYLNQEESKPSIFKSLKYNKSATAAAFDEIIARKKVKEQEDAIRELFTSNWQNPNMGLDGYRDFIEMRRRIKRKREKELYNQMRRRKAFLYNTKMGLAISFLTLTLIYMIHFLWTIAVESSK